MSQGIPENSLAAFRRAVGRGFGAELDVHLLADNALAVGGLQVHAVPITDWDTIAPDAGTMYLVYDPEVTG